MTRSRTNQVKVQCLNAQALATQLEHEAGTGIETLLNRKTRKFSGLGRPGARPDGRRVGRGFLPQGRLCGRL
jgi:hypothetical protein